MDNKLEKRYGLFTAIAMVVGIVIGSGVFFKAQTILQKTNGDLPLGILAWVIGGAIMIFCVLAFANMATRYEKVNGIVDYSEAVVSKNYAYYVGWFMTTIYYPTLTGVLAWLSARYTLTFIVSVNPSFPLVVPADQGGAVIGPECMALMLFFLCCAYAVNALSPKLAGKFQVATTVIKMIPLALMAVVGLIYGLTHGITQANFAAAPAAAAAGSANPLFAAVVATSFAYEGWIIATSINAELRDAKKNLPRALIIGGIIVIATYILYYIGVAGGATNQELMETGATVAFTKIFGNVLGNVLNLFIAISCMGTMNGLMLGCCRGVYSLSVRDQGPVPHIFGQVDRETNMPANSSILAMLLCGFWGCYFVLANLSADPGSWFGKLTIAGQQINMFAFDSSELPIVTIYAMYIPLFILFMKKSTDLKFGKRFLIPALALAGSIFMVYACIFAHKWECLFYLIVFAVFMLAGGLFKNSRKSAAKATQK